VDCSWVLSSAGGSIGPDAVQCPNNFCAGYILTSWGFMVNGPIFMTGYTFYQFEAFSDDSAGYLSSDAPVGYSVMDIANAAAIMQTANQSGQKIDPATLTGKALDTYNILASMLTNLGLNPADIQIYQPGTQSFSFQLPQGDLEAIQDSGDIVSHIGDVAMHYPYSDGARGAADDSSGINNLTDLHTVWLDPSLTDYVGGSGVYMQAHMDRNNPFNSPGDFFAHMGCALLKVGCN
jgi:hypothetical protein